MNALLNSVAASLKANTQTEAIAQIDRVTKFCMDNGNEKVFGGWGEDIIRLLVAYHWAKQTLLVDEEDGEIKGVGMWYKCNESDGREFLDEWMEDRPDGDSIFPAFLCCTSTASFKRIVVNFINREPAVLTHKMYGSRLRNGVDTRVNYSLRIFKKLLSIKE